ncbi:MAG: SDR family oxidoreductase [Chloroflexi bacterium]|nr:SDR family oxidoreductase [Chloroflexota bacterium]
MAQITMPVEYGRGTPAAPVYLIGGEGYIGSLLQTFLPRNNLIRVGNPRKQYADPGVLTNLPSRVLPNSRCILLAALTGEKACEEDRKLADETNVELVKRVCELGFSRIIFASTTSLYGVTDSYASEQSPLRITSYYTETKLRAEEIVLGANAGNIVARLAIAIGVSPKMDWTQLTNVLVKSGLEGQPLAIYGPHSFRPYCDVYDISRGLLLLLDRFDLDGRVINVGSTALNCTKLDLVENLQKLIPSLKYTLSGDVDKRSYKVSFAKFEQMYQCALTLKDSFARLIDCHRANFAPRGAGR